MAEQQQQERMVKIRMKPGCGRMLIGRKWKLSDGVTIVDKPPKDPSERLQPVDVWLEAREVDNEGNVGEGPTATVPESLLAGMLVDGKPSRLIDGYEMNVTKASLETNEIGETIRTHASASPRLKQGKHEDATFEIVR